MREERLEVPVRTSAVLATQPIDPFRVHPIDCSYIDSGNGARRERVRFRNVPATDQANMDGHVDGWSVICRDEALIGGLCAIGRGDLCPNQNAIAQRNTCVQREREVQGFFFAVREAWSIRRCANLAIPACSSVVVFPDAESLIRRYRYA